MAASSNDQRRSTLDVEAEYLRYVAISIHETDSRKKALKRRELELIADRHECTPACIFINLRVGEKFEYRGRSYNATGCVYVCRQLAKSHVCGDFCSDFEVMPRGEGCYCRVRGVHLYREFSLARSRLDRDVRVVGPVSYVSHAFYDFEEAAEDTQQQKDYADDSDDDKTTQTETVEDEEADQTYHEPVYETLLKRANNNDVDVRRVIERFPRMTTAELCEQIDQRVARRACAEAVWKVHAISAKYREIQHKKAEADTMVWMKDSKEYIDKCRSMGEEPDLLHIMRLWLIYVRNSYRGVYVGGDIEETNRKNSVYYIECMLRLWEKYDNLPIVRERRVTFSQCCTALLKSLQEGLTITVWFVGTDPKPRRSGSLTELARSRSTMTSVQMIRAHPDLKLVPREVIRVVNNKEKSVSTAAKTGRCRFISGKLAFTNRQRTDQTKKRQKDAYSHDIPPQKHLCNIMDEIVNKSKDIDELMSYAF